MIDRPIRDCGVVVGDIGQPGAHMAAQRRGAA